MQLCSGVCQSRFGKRAEEVHVNYVYMQSVCLLYVYMYIFSIYIYFHEVNLLNTSKVGCAATGFAYCATLRGEIDNILMFFQ